MYTLPERLALMKIIPLLARLDVTQQRLIAEKMQEETHDPDKIIFEEGEMGKRLYIIVSGTVIVSKDRKPYARHTLAELHKGDFFGEIALLKNIPRTARITTKTRCEFLTLEAKDFLHLYEHFPPLLRSDIQMIIKKRLEAQNIRTR